MYLRSITYAENQGQPNSWTLKKLTFGNVNLIVGKNSSGKSRVVSIINALAMAVSGKGGPFNSGTWTAEFDRQKGLQVERQIYQASYRNSLVTQESLKIKSELIMERGETGEGFVAKKKGARVKYQVPKNRLMSVMRSDAFQHPQFEHLQGWGANLCVYRFGSEFGKGSMAGQSLQTGVEQQAIDLSGFAENPSNVFLQSLQRFGDRFKAAVLEDMRSIGYECSDIGMFPMPEFPFGGMSPLILAVKEESIECYTTQNEMSQGMYRALALLIQFNANILWTQSLKVGRELLPGDSPMIVIDDIGEGLDYERSTKLISILVSKALEYKVQIVMSSNDRFIMNAVPLEYWTVLSREGSVVNSYSYDNSKEVFDEFDYLGLNNFDFFSSEFWKKGLN